MGKVREFYKKHEGQIWFAGCCLVFGGIAIGSVYRSNQKVNKLEALLDRTVNNISSDIHVQVPQAIVNEAIERAVTRQVDYTIKAVAGNIADKVRTDIRGKVATIVDEAYPNVKASVFDEVKRQIAGIDIMDLKREIKNEAKEKMMEKFEGDLESLLSEFNQNLTNVSKIYNSIAENITKKNETVVKIG